jgi:hypothetical protein
MDSHSGRRPRRNRWGAKLVAGAAVASVLATGAVVGPLAPAQPAMAASGSSSSTWLSAINSAFGTSAKFFALDSNPYVFSANIALTLLGPLVASASAGPSISDVMNGLGDVKNDIAALTTTLDRVETEVLNIDSDLLLGVCELETRDLTALRHSVSDAQDQFATIAVESASVATASDVGPLRDRVDDFIDNVLGENQYTFLNATPLGSALGLAHDELTSTTGDHGVIETCGRAYLAAWRAQNAAVASPTDAAWLDDRAYYEPLQTLVTYWQTVQAQGMYLLQQAALLEAVLEYDAQTTPLAPDEVPNVCALATEPGSPATHAAEICSSLETTTDKFRADIIVQWTQTGVPYSDDDIVLSLGSAVTGLTASGGGSIPSTAWIRDPSAFPGGVLGGPNDDTLATSVFDTIDGWKPGDSVQWEGMEAGFAVSHPHVQRTPQEVAQPWYVWAGEDSDETWDEVEWTKTGLSPYTSLDLLMMMGASRQPDGVTATFADSAVKSPVWIPTEKATFDLSTRKIWSDDHDALSGGSGLAFAPATYFDWQGNEAGSYYAGPGLSVWCMVAPSDGVLCDDARVGSWWVANMHADYTSSSDDILWEDAAGTWTVTPGSPELSSFTTTGTETCLITDDYCPIPMNGQTTMAPWVVPFIDDNQILQTPSDAAAQETRWPALEMPTAEGCTTPWGVPTRCQTGFDAWVAATIPDRAAEGPVATAPSTVVAGTDPGTLGCEPPAWAEDQDADGNAVVDGSTTWTAVAANGDTAAVTFDDRRPVSIADDLLPAGTWTAGTPTELSIACNVSARFAGTPDVVSVAGQASVVTSDAAGTWTVSATAATNVTSAPASVLSADGAAAVLTAQATVAASAPESPVAPAAVSARSMVALAAPAAASVVRWQRRDSGTALWEDLGSVPETVQRISPAGAPRLLARNSVTSSYTVPSLSAADHGDAYRAVFTAPDGTTVTTAEAVLSVTAAPVATPEDPAAASRAAALASTGGSPAGWVWLAGALAAAAGAGVLLVRRGIARRP